MEALLKLAIVTGLAALIGTLCFNSCAHQEKHIEVDKDVSIGKSIEFGGASPDMLHECEEGKLQNKPCKKEKK